MKNREWAWVAYVIVALALSWAAQIAVGLAHLEPERAVNNLAATMFLPGLVAIAFVKLVHREQLTDYGLGWRAGLGGWRGWLGAWFGPFLVLTVPLLALSLVVFRNPLHADFTTRGLVLTLGVQIPIFILISTFTNGLGEEFGWRGYLLRRVRRTMGLLRGTLVVGAIWAAFHAPIILLSEAAVRPWVTLVTYSVTAMSLAPVFSWFAVKARRGSVILPALLHASINVWNQLLVGEVALAMPGLLQGEASKTWIFAVEGLAGMVLCLLASIPFWIALSRMDRAGVGFEAPRSLRVWDAVLEKPPS